MSSIAADLRHAVRVLLKSPGFAIVAILTIAIGIGANTAIFSVMDRVLLRPLPFPDSERIMRLQRRAGGDYGPSISIPKFMAWRKADAFQSMAAYDFASVAMRLGTGDRPEPVATLHASAAFFDVFGVKPLIGRTFTSAEDLPDAGRFAVLTFNLWKNRLGADREIVGRTVVLNGETYQVLGILPEWFQSDPPADLYLPEQLDPASTNQGHIYLVAGRLHPGASIESAVAELTPIAARFRAQYPDTTEKNETVGVVPLRVAIGGEVRPALLILSGAVVFVMLMACANVANLMLARAAGRSRELAIRTAVGAGRGRIVRQLLTESLLLAGAGAVVGMALGAAGVRILLGFSPGNIPRINDPSHLAGALTLVDWRVLAFLLAITAFTGILCGLLPALRATRVDVSLALKESSGRSGTGRHNRIRGLLVVGEISLAIVLLAGAALMIRTFAGLRAVKPGLDPSGVLTVQVSTSGTRYQATARVESMVRAATQRLEALPGVEFAAGALILPMSGAAIDMPFSIEGRPPAVNGKWEGDEQWRYVSAHYFEALRIPILRGRAFDLRDTGKAPPAVIVNQAFARKYWPNGDPLGQRMTIAKGLGRDFDEGARQIVGIAGSVTETGVGNGPVPVMYVPQSQVTDGVTRLAGSLVPMNWVIRTRVDPLSVATAVRREFDALDAQLSPSKIRTMEQVIADSSARGTFNTLVLAVFAAVALLLAAVGIYGLMSYMVEQRTQEIGIRMALGAGRGKMLGLILSRGMLLAAIGIAIGSAGAFGLTRVLAGLLFGVKSNDPLTYAGVALILASVALIAAFIPARRATRIDPLAALRQE